MLIKFEIKNNDVIFKDAIELPDNHTLTASEINAIKKKRFDDWLAAIAPEFAED